MKFEYVRNHLFLFGLQGCIKLWISSCLVIILFQTKTCQTGCQDVSSISGYTLTRHTYRMMSRVRLITCIVTCQDDPECYSINFKFPIEQCELNNETRLSIEPQYFVPSPNTVYLDNLYRPYKPCDKAPCKNNGSCVIIIHTQDLSVSAKMDTLGRFVKVSQKNSEEFLKNFWTVLEKAVVFR